MHFIENNYGNCGLLFFHNAYINTLDVLYGENIYCPYTFADK